MSLGRRNMYSFSANNRWRNIENLVYSKMGVNATIPRQERGRKESYLATKGVIEAFLDKINVIEVDCPHEKIP